MIGVAQIVSELMGKYSQSAPFDHESVTRISASKGRQLLDVGELWAYRELLVALTLRDIKVRYKQTVLGAAWAIIQPLTMMAIFSVIFGKLASIPSEGLPYPVFVYAALLPWMFFANALTTAGSSLVNASNLVSKIYFPRLIIPLAAIGSGLVDLVISSTILLVLMLYYDIAWTANLLMAPILVVGVAVTAFGVGAVLSALTVSYRDFRFVVPFLIQVWMYLTPVVYGTRFIPEEWRWLLAMNPMSGYIEGFRSAFLGEPFVWDSLMVSGVLSLTIVLVGIGYFGRVERRFSDVI